MTDLRHRLSHEDVTVHQPCSSASGAVIGGNAIGCGRARGSAAALYCHTFLTVCIVLTHIAPVGYRKMSSGPAIFRRSGPDRRYPMAIDIPENLLTPGEVAQMFRVDPKTVTRWAASGRIGSIRTPGGHRRFRESEVKDLLDDRSVGASPSAA